MRGQLRAFVIGAATSGAGKTTVTMAILAALRRRGLVVQPFKAGPDFIDPGHHAVAAGRPSHNLDTWMLSADENRAIFQRHAAGADVAVVEGVMGLHDGFGPLDDTGSTAHLAKLLGLPVALVVDAKGMAGSIAALAGGFVNFDPALGFVGVIANRVGGPGHAAILGQALAGRSGLPPFLGGLVRESGLAMPERHLGLITADEGAFDAAKLARLADWAEQGLDLDALLAGAAELDLIPLDEPAPPTRPVVTIGVARDAAFCFYYAENLRRLRQAGATLKFFSPIDDPAPPPGLDGLYLGGGYPELFAHKLSQNQTMRRAIARAVADGLPVLAECGGMLYLGQAVVDKSGQGWPMAGALDIVTRMGDKLSGLGYRQATFTADNPLGPAGTTGRGHEFHYSSIDEGASGAQAGVFELCGRAGGPARLAGYRVGNAVASYMHFHFGGNPDLARNFVEFCRKGQP